HHSYAPGSAPATRLDVLVASFTAAWQQGRQPGIDAFLPADGDALFRHAALIELVHADLKQRAAAGTPVSAEHYFVRYPQLEQDPDVAFNLLVAVQDARRR